MKARGASAGAVVSDRAPRAFIVYGFATTHDALAAEAVLKRAAVPVTPIPAPRELGSLCGIAMRAEPADATRVEGVLAEAGPPWIARAEIEDV
jgi:hypothetical protein